MNNAGLLIQLELVGGPECGAVKDVPESTERFEVEYLRIMPKKGEVTLHAIYENRNDGKGYYIEG